MKQSLCLAAVAMSMIGCAAETPTFPAPVLPEHGAAARLELTTTAQAGGAAITVRVIDAYAAPVQTAVELQTSAGSLSATSVTTNAQGLASATLSASPGVVTVSARAGTLKQDTLVAVQPVPPTTPPNPPTPPPAPPDPPLPPLTVSINVTPGLAGSTTQFSLSTTALASASWAFGDGGTATTVTGYTSHVYANAGTYPVSVTVTDMRGRTASNSTTATVPALPPPGTPGMTVLLKASTTSVAIGGTVTFTATIDNLQTGETVTAYQWDLDGNGSFESTSTTATRTSAAYATAGFVTARVAITTNQHAGGGAVTIVVTN